MSKLIVFFRSLAKVSKKMLMRTVFENGDLMSRPIYTFGFYLTENTLLLDYNFIILVLFKYKIVVYCWK
jgi:hypothetical protein